jgi:diguanylate cyclase (GGDEF)-like protein
LNIGQYRNQFHILIVASDAHSAADLKRYVQSIGYMPEVVGEKDLLFDHVRIKPPHMILFFYNDRNIFTDYDDAKDTIVRLRALLPEVHVFCLADDFDRASVTQLYDHGVEDVLSWPLETLSELRTTLDRAAERDFYMYQNEQKWLVNKGEGASTPINNYAKDSGDIIDFTEMMTELPSRELVIDYLLQELSRLTRSKEIIYFKFVNAASALVADRGMGWASGELKDIGIDLKQTEVSFSSDQLKYPQLLRGLEEFVKVGLNKKQYVSYPVEVQNTVVGVLVVLLTQRPSATEWPDADIKLTLKLVSYRLRQLELEEQLQKFLTADVQSEALNREGFKKRMNEELARARRILKPVSLLMIHIDNYADYTLAHNVEDVTRFLKAFVSLVTRCSRPTDIIGRLSDNEFALLLPHTNQKGAAIKAERLRRIIEASDFTRVMSDELKVTVSIGVSEYPSMAHTSSDLLKVADQALTEVLRTTKNRVCIASPDAGFMPDFEDRGQ